MRDPEKMSRKELVAEVKHCVREQEEYAEEVQELRRQLDEAKRERDEWHTAHNELQTQYTLAKDRADKAEAQAAELWSTLKHFEWADNCVMCMHCANTSSVGHAEDCEVSKALSLDAGRELLERVRRLEKVEQAARILRDNLFGAPASADYDYACVRIPDLDALEDALSALDRKGA